jgi:DNA-binding NarL/FixJ family response regulator/class 3 adenylate cyclase
MTRTDELTFLLTDIEGSTCLVRDLGEKYADVLGDSRALLKEAIENHGGRVVDCRADESFAVFTSARDAVAAALTAQRALVAHAWPDGASVRIRMGLHTGTAASDGDDDFVGLDVHQAARISSAAHGGQVLVSAKTAAVSEAPVRDLGAYELAGLEEPARIFQVLAEDLPSEFPALRSARRCDRRRLRVALADDSVLVREGIARVLEEAGMEIVAQAGTAEDLLRHVEVHEPDVAIVDIRMPPTGTDEGLRAGREVRRRFPTVGVLLLSQLLEPVYAVDLLVDGADGVGYLLKDRVGDLDEFAAAVHRVAAGGCAVDSAIVSNLLHRFGDGGGADPLMQREREVLALLAQGHASEEIAARLFVPLATVEDAVARVLTRIGLPASLAPAERPVAVLLHLVGRWSSSGAPSGGDAGAPPGARSPAGVT